MEFTYLEQYKYPTNIVLNLTDDCNLACIYCFVQQKPHYMTLDIAKKSVDFIVNNYNIKKENNWLRPDEEKTIVFFGGEPMIMFDKIIVPLIHYIEEQYDINEFNLNITTNGTLLTEKRIEFLRKYNIYPLLSIDGNRETQEYNRPCKNCNDSSFDLIEKNIPYLLKSFPNTVFRSTVYKDNIHNLYDDFKYAESKGFKFYTCVPDARSHNWTEQDLNEYKHQINKITSYILNYYLAGGEPSIMFNNLYRALRLVIIHDKNRKNIIHNNKYAYRCGLGTIACSVNYCGQIFGCQEQDTRAENGEYFYLGHINTGIEEELQSKLIQDYFNSECDCEKKDECNKCIIKNECYHGCPSTQKDLFDDLGKCSYVVCQDNIHIFNCARAFMKILVENNNSLFKEILSINVKQIYGLQKGECIL